MGFILRKENLFLKVSLLFIFSLGLYFCFIGGYGSDEDTLPMIYSLSQNYMMAGFSHQDLLEILLLKLVSAFYLFFWKFFSKSFYLFIFIVWIVFLLFII